MYRLRGPGSEEIGMKQAQESTDFTRVCACARVVMSDLTMFIRGIFWGSFISSQ